MTCKVKSGCGNLDQKIGEWLKWDKVTYLCVPTSSTD